MQSQTQEWSEWAPGIQLCSFGSQRHCFKKQILKECHHHTDTVTQLTYKHTYIGVIKLWNKVNKYYFESRWFCIDLKHTLSSATKDVGTAQNFLVDTLHMARTWFRLFEFQTVLTITDFSAQQLVHIVDESSAEMLASINWGLLQNKRIVFFIIVVFLLFAELNSVGFRFRVKPLRSCLLTLFANYIRTSRSWRCCSSYSIWLPRNWSLERMGLLRIAIPIEPVDAP